MEGVSDVLVRTKQSHNPFLSTINNNDITAYSVWFSSPQEPTTISAIIDFSLRPPFLFQKRRSTTIRDYDGHVRFFLLDE